MKKIIKFGVVISLILLVILLIVIRIYDKTTKDVNNYESVIDESCYFSLKRGYVYNIGDTIEISKFINSNDYTFEITNVMTKEKKTFKPTKSISDLSLLKFNELISYKITDTFIAESSGIYILTLKNENNSFNDILFVNNNNTDPKIKVILSDYNWICYNEFGGKSNYRDMITPRYRKSIDRFKNMFRKNIPSHNISYKLGINRPNASNNEEIKEFLEDDFKFKEGRMYHCVVSELPLISLLFSEYPNQFQIIDCNQFANQSYSNIKNGLFIFNGHSEYWSSHMIGRLNIEKSKNNILFLSGNNMYREVVNRDKSLTVVNQQIPSEIVSPILGSYYDDIDYMKNSSLIIRDTTHFLFQGVNNKEIGGDYVASHETDKITKETGSNVEILATGKTVKCDVVLIKNKKHHLLNLSSVGSYNGLNEPNFKQFILNYINFSIKRNSYENKLLVTKNKRH